MACYVFRINYYEYYEKLKQEIGVGRLRQGWGAKDMDIHNDYDTFAAAWHEHWPDDDASEKSIRRKYNNLCIMKSIKKGDYIIVPKMDMGNDWSSNCFTILRCTDEYSFDLPSFTNDFGHIIGVQVLFSCPYESSLEAIEISGKFRSYQSALNNIWKQSVIASIEKLIENHEKSEVSSVFIPKNLIRILSGGVKDQYDSFVQHVLTTLREKLSPQQFERIIIELFVKNGYVLKRRNDYDKIGGDIDITLTIDDHSILGSIFAQSNTVGDFEINIQAKKKIGMDKEDIDAVNQLVTRKETKNSDSIGVNVVIDLTDDFQPETEEEARKNSIILINGYQFASMLVQYGLAGEIEE